MLNLQLGYSITTDEFIHLVSSSLYSKRFAPYFVEPIVAGLNTKLEPVIYSTDLIGCINSAEDFVVTGTASNGLYGVCEAFYENNMVIFVE